MPSEETDLIIKESALLKVCSYVDMETETYGSYEELALLLTRYLDELIRTDFNRLLALLYRVDVYEDKIKQALATRSKDVSEGRIFADLLIERQLEKLAYRKKYEGTKNWGNDD